jgi:hypothetical protein
MAGKRTRTSYQIVLLRDGTYAVQAKSGRVMPLTISGFETEDEARAWIETNLEEGSDPKAP